MPEPDVSAEQVAEWKALAVPCRSDPVGADACCECEKIHPQNEKVIALCDALTEARNDRDYRIAKLEQELTEARREAERQRQLKENNTERWQFAQNRLAMTEQSLIQIHGEGGCGIEDSLNAVRSQLATLRESSRLAGEAGEDKKQ